MPNDNSPGKPNILIIQPDQHRGFVMGCAGDSLVKTPNLDRLAGEGIRFTNCISSSPVCSPTRGSFQTGLYPHKHGVDKNNVQLDPNLLSMADLFAAAGYVTGYIGKWHLDGSNPEDTPGGYIQPGKRRHGWQEWQGYEKGHDFFNVYKYENGIKVRVSGYDWEPEWYTDMTLDFMQRNNDRGKPFLYYLSYGPPHKPEQCPEYFLDLYDPDEFTVPPEIKVRLSREQEKELRKKLQIYYGQVTAIDREIGRIIKGLKEMGIEDNTIVMYTSDHGDILGYHLRDQGDTFRGKSSPLEAAFRIPLIIRWPERIKPGQVCSSLVNSVDHLPTLLELAGLEIPDVMQGDSMAGWCLSGSGHINEVVYLGLGGVNDLKSWWRAVWDGRYLYSVQRAGENFLYDLKADPYQINNVIEQVEYVSVKNRMQENLLCLAGKTEDPLLLQARDVLDNKYLIDSD